MPGVILFFKSRSDEGGCFLVKRSSFFFFFFFFVLRESYMFILRIVRSYVYLWRPRLSIQIEVSEIT